MNFEFNFFKYLCTVPHFHLWKTTGYSFFGQALEKKCTSCGKYKHKRDGRSYEWLDGKHPTSKDNTQPNTGGI